MSRDMSVSLVIRGDGQGARRAALNAKAGLSEMGKTARSAGDQVKKAASEQAAAIRAGVTSTAGSMAVLKKVGASAGEAIKRGLAEGVREQDRLGSGADRLADRIKRSLRRIGEQGGVFRILSRSALSEFGRIKSALGSMQGRLAAAGVGFAVGQQIKSSAQMDRSLLRTRQTAGMTRAQQGELRENLWQMARQNGNSVGSLSSGFDKLIASGLSYEASKETIGAIDVGSTISGADTSVLADGLLAGASAYEFDLSKPGQALDLLEKMIVAGRAGNAELENLADIFATVGPSAKRGGMGFEQSLALVETLSLLERAPDRLKTLADSTTRLFTNKNYMKSAAKATGVRFFDAKGERRDMTDVLGDLKTKYDALRTDKQRMEFVSNAFGQADLDTQKGIQFLLTGNNLQTLRTTQTDITGAKGVIDKDLVENRDSASAVAGRMQANFGAAMDRMSQPINKAFAEAGSYLLDDLDLSGEQMLGLAAGGAIAGHYAGRVGGAALGKLSGVVGGGVDTLKNIAVGKSLQDATGVMPVFVTNWAGAPASPVGALSSAADGKPASRSGGGSMIKRASAALWPWLKRVALPVAAYGLSEVQVDRSESATNARGLDDSAKRGDRGAAEQLARQQLQNQWWRGTPTAAEIAERATQLMGSPEDQARLRPPSPVRASASAKIAARTGRFGAAALQLASAALPVPLATEAKLTAPALPAAAQQQFKQQTADQITSAARVLDTARRGLEQTLGKPLQVHVTTDTPWLLADVGRSVERDARRSPP